MHFVLPSGMPRHMHLQAQNRAHTEALGMITQATDTSPLDYSCPVSSSRFLTQAQKAVLQGPEKRNRYDLSTPWQRSGKVPPHV